MKENHKKKKKFERTRHEKIIFAKRMENKTKGIIVELKIKKL